MTPFELETPFDESPDFESSDLEATPGEGSADRAANRQLAVACWQELGHQERHLTAQQTRYRGLASVWLLATFVATGVVLTSADIALSLHPMLLISLAGVSGGAGLILLWNMDLMVTNRLVDAVFIEGLRLEQRHGQLPPVRHNMMALYGGRGVLEKVAAFYYSSIVFCGLVAGIAMTAWTAEIRPELTGWVGLAAVAVLGLTLATMRASTGHTRQLLGSLARSTRAVQARREMEGGI